MAGPRRTLLARRPRVRSYAIGTLTILAGALLIRARRRRKLGERVAAASLESLLGAIDANDADTGAHVRRVASYAITLARAAGLSERDVHAVERVALFHDIGKIHAALFDIVHDDDDELSEEERERIATHPARGAEVLRPLEVFYPELPDGVLSHHERWDGEGYPRGLRAAEIPVAARIVAIADTFDVLTAGRSYRDAGSLVEGWRTIERGRGSQFDPRLVDIFLSVRVRRRAERALHRKAHRKVDVPRRRGRTPKRAPDITFRWRDGAAVQRAQDPQHRKAP